MPSSPSMSASKKQYHIGIIARNILFDMFCRFFMRFHFNAIRVCFLRSFGSQIGKHVHISRKTDVKAPWCIRIGNNVIVNKNVLLDGRGGLEIGDNVDIAQDVFIWTAQHDYNDDYHKYITGKVVINDYAWLASRSMILPGVTVGRGAVVAAGAVVTKDVETMALVGGIPAKVVGHRESLLLYTLHKESGKNKKL